MDLDASKAGKLIDDVRDNKPLVHHITNYVTVNDVANAVLALGGAPVMADEFEDAVEMAGMASSLVLNMGTLNRRTIDSMVAAGKRANERGIPVVFDPVGAGATSLRNETARMLLQEVKMAVVRGNLSEISFIAGLKAVTRGVDSGETEAGANSSAIARTAAGMWNCSVAMTGAIDVITDGRKTIGIANGHPMMARVTGTGCMASALVGTCAGATDDMLLAALAGTAAMGIAGELAWERTGDKGTGSFRTALMDALSIMEQSTMEQWARFHENFS
ncbi:hydroxyethylthiazole kinase [Akkermansia sp. N21169]|uniref:hydroxyethylthiazole kinase n=1 Tax=Akkermansia sp. N21169 TaxID=3040765 RepID=UPI00244EF556|nr:hydroxyethylthiazole kinase [Akkermansia sp. N21169]MDH3068681.1 hydroxyethylthiazole kinase [Akkermansia sp. N21169]